VDENGVSTFVPGSIQCEELGCEVLWYADPVPEDCETCRRHIKLADVLLLFLYLVAPATALIITITQDWEEASPKKYLLYKIIHSINILVWYPVALTLKLYRCDCRFSWVIDNITSVFAPLIAVLLLVTVEAQRNGNSQETTKRLDDASMKDECASSTKGDLSLVLATDSGKDVSETETC